MLFKVACVIQIAFFDPTKKNQILLFFSGNPVSVLKKKFTINKSEAFIKKWFGFLSETIHRKQLLSGEHFLLEKAPTSHKN